MLERSAQPRGAAIAVASEGLEAARLALAIDPASGAAWAHRAALETIRASLAGTTAERAAWRQAAAASRDRVAALRPELAADLPPLQP